MIDFESIWSMIKDKANEALGEKVSQLLDNMQKWLDQEVKVNISVFNNTKFADQAKLIVWSVEPKDGGGYTISANFSALVAWAQDYFEEVVYPNIAQAVGI